MSPRCSLKHPPLILWSSIFHDFQVLGQNDSVSQYFPLRYGHGVDTIGKSVKKYQAQRMDVSFGGLEPEISWSKGGPGTPTGGTPPEAIWRPLLTWRRVLRTTLTTILQRNRERA